jgi:hypothetical protein
VGYNVRGTSPALLKETWDYCTLKMKKIADQYISSIAEFDTIFFSGYADISHTHERISREPGNLSQLAWLVGRLLRLQLPPAVELIR